MDEFVHYFDPFERNRARSIVSPFLHLPLLLPFYLFQFVFFVFFVLSLFFPNILLSSSFLFNSTSPTFLFSSSSFFISTSKNLLSSSSSAFFFSSSFATYISFLPSLLLFFSQLRLLFCLLLLVSLL